MKRLLLSTALALGLALPALGASPVPCELNIGEAVAAAQRNGWSLRAIEPFAVLGAADQVVVFATTDGRRVVAFAYGGCMVSNPMVLSGKPEGKV